jgi:hypothetical protein
MQVNNLNSYRRGNTDELTSASHKEKDFPGIWTAR